MILKEGEAIISLSVIPATSKGPAKRSKIFYNPAMRNNRSICTLMCEALGIKSFLDGFAATGVRGIRVIKEAGSDVIFNDCGREAFFAIKNNLELNNIEAEVLNEDFCSLKSSAELCDVDPFGTPEPFLSKGLELSERFLAVTATDTAVLFGSNAKKCYERYGVKVKKVSWSKELGARVLCHTVARKAKMLGKGVKPLFVYAEDHYLRGYFEICDCDEGISDEKITQTHVDGMGPIWTGNLNNRGVLKKALEISKNKKKEYAGKNFIEKLFLRAIEEVDTIGYYDVDYLSSKFRVEEPKTQVLVERLKEQGFQASRTIFSPKGIKTDAPLNELKRAFEG